jgi:hypothetical protein
MEAEKGIVYIAYGEKAINLTENAISILRQFNDRLPVAVVSNEPVTGADYWIEHEDTDLGARHIKTNVYHLSPFQQTLYMDADTELMRDPEPYFVLLESVDLVMGLDYFWEFRNNTWGAISRDEIETTNHETGEGRHLYYNTGVMLFNKCDEVEQLMLTWHEEWLRWGKQDQPAMFRAMHQCPVRMAPMNWPFNTHQEKVADFVYHKHRAASRPGAPK